MPEQQSAALPQTVPALPQVTRSMTVRFGQPVVHVSEIVGPYSGGSSSRWLTGFLTGRRSYDALNTLRAPVAVAAGQSPQPPPAPSSSLPLDYCAGAHGLDGTTWTVTPYYKADSAFQNYALVSGFDPHDVQ
jgi:hypothetical protein